MFDKNKFEEVMLKYGFAKNMLETEINILIDEYEFKNGYNPVEHKKSRIKKEQSIKNKLIKNGYEVTIDNMLRNIHDIIGLRIICSFKSDVYKMVDIIKSSNQFIIKRECDYIKNPKDSGYTSYHLNVYVPLHLEGKTEYIEAEIQIRTVAMDCWASLDHKLRYKLPREIPNYFEKELQDCASFIDDIDNKMQGLYDEIINYQNENKD